MDNNERSSRLWRFLDGSVSVSASVMVALLLYEFAYGQAPAWIPALGYLAELTHRDDGVIIAATLLLAPTTAILYGGSIMIFAAKEKVQQHYTDKGKAIGRQEGRKEGRQEGREEERQLISKMLNDNGVAIPPELERHLNRQDTGQ